jgi:hypothetical protein
MRQDDILGSSAKRPQSHNLERQSLCKSSQSSGTAPESFLWEEFKRYFVGRWSLISSKNLIWIFPRARHQFSNSIASAVVLSSSSANQPLKATRTRVVALFRQWWCTSPLYSTSSPSGRGVQGPLFDPLEGGMSICTILSFKGPLTTLPPRHVYSTKEDMSSPFFLK